MIMFGLSKGRLATTSGLCALIMLCGCSINKLIPPPYAASIQQHSRFFGLTAAWQGYGVKLGWGSEVWALIPVSTNKLWAAPVSDTFKLGQGLNPFSTLIIEDLQTFNPDGPPPAPRFQHLFHPKDQEKLESPKAKDQSAIQRRDLDARILESVKKVPPPVVPQTVTLSDLEYAGLRSAAMGTNPTMTEIHYHFHLETPPQPPPEPGK